ncbi:hypothetical protein TSMEX_009153 [Taenia solium]|eukprot:TsM_000666500 transcript=TsM_000666500 gene=TsM_000666500
MKEMDFASRILEVKEEFLRIAESVHDDIRSASQFFDSVFVESVLSLNSPSGIKLKLGGKTEEPLVDDSGLNQDKSTSEIADFDPVNDNEATLVRLLSEMSVEELRFLKSQLLAELDWLDQAISNRKQFLLSVLK